MALSYLIATVVMSKLRKILWPFQKTLIYGSIHSEKAANFCEMSTLNLSYVATVKSTLEILQTFVAFSEYMNFKGQYILQHPVLES